MEKYKLFFDTSFSFITIALYQNNQIRDFFVKENNKKHADNAPDLFFLFLNKNKINISQINCIYITNGPGSFIGVRVSCLIIKCIKLINHDVKIYSASFLNVHRLFNEKISLSTRFAKTKKIVIEGNDYKICVDKNPKIIEKDKIIKNLKLLPKYFGKFKENNKLEIINIY